MGCKHESFLTKCTVNRLEDSGRFMLDIEVVCEQCQTPFVFKGLPVGVNLEGACVSVSGREARLAIAPMLGKAHGDC